MVFEAWLRAKHGIDHKTFELRHQRVQAEMIEEYNNEQRCLK